MINMADTTISFKIEEDLRDKAQNLIKSSGMTGKEWFQRAVAMVELQSVKEGATDYASDLSEMEVHTRYKKRRVTFFKATLLFLYLCR
jgi:hypothetical protein